MGYLSAYFQSIILHIRIDTDRRDYFLRRMCVLIRKTKVIMNIKKLINTARKPEIYTPGTAVMWVDEYISTQLLATHLSQDIELASRKETTITSTVE